MPTKLEFGEENERHQLDCWHAGLALHWCLFLLIDRRKVEFYLLDPSFTILGWVLTFSMTKTFDVLCYNFFYDIICLVYVPLSLIHLFYVVGDQIAEGFLEVCLVALYSSTYSLNWTHAFPMFSGLVSVDITEIFFLFVFICCFNFVRCLTVVFDFVHRRIAASVAKHKNHHLIIWRSLISRTNSII